MRAVIMAGGRGLRLHPLTEHCPKPMLHVGGKPILETILTRLVKQGVEDIVMVLHYKADIIRQYFQHGLQFGCHIEYEVEKEPLGTAGSLLPLRSFLGDGAIVTNADVISDIDYRRLLETNRNRAHSMTVAAALWQRQVPYGVLDYTVEGLQAIREKPIQGLPVCAGIYAVTAAAATIIPPGRPYDMNEMMTDLMRNSPCSVGVYEVDGYWTDVGTFEDLSRASTA